MGLNAMNELFDDLFLCCWHWVKLDNGILGDNLENFLRRRNLPVYRSQCNG